MILRHILSDIHVYKRDAMARVPQSVKKVAKRHFFEFYGFASRVRSRAAKPVKYENLWGFIRSDAHVVRAGLNIRGCRPLSTPGLIDRLRDAMTRVPYGISNNYI